MTAKATLHPRNQHLGGYDFARLTAKVPALASVTTTNPLGQTTIDFSDAGAVRLLNQALLLAHYNVDFWDIPADYLCPPIPGRVDYIHHLADLLAESNGGRPPRGPDIKALDIGTGASLIYPLVGQHEYGWDFVGVDIDPVSLQSAREITRRNGLHIALRRQQDAAQIFQGVIGAKDLFHVTLCNPPFHASPEQAAQGTRRKWRNLGKGETDTLNFGGQNAELWCPGGEIGFIARMIEESTACAEQCLWFTSLVSRKDSLIPLVRLLTKARVNEYRIVEMGQGQKISRFLAWTYYPKRQRTL